MNDLQINPGDDLRAVAFKVCSAFENSGAKAVLTGGSAATVYAPDAYQSRDVDFIAYYYPDAEGFRRTIADLGFSQKGTTYAHPEVPVTLDIPDEEIRIGNDLVDRFATLHENGLTLHILTPTDCVRDRLASFFWFRDRSALAAALGVAKAQRAAVDLQEVAEWAAREGEAAKFTEFAERLGYSPPG